MLDCSPNRRSRTDGGFAIWLIIAAIALMAVMGWGISTTSHFGAQISTSTRMAGDLFGQGNLIESRVSLCYLSYPAGGWPATPATGLARDLICPGAPVGAQPLWTGTDGVFLPAPPYSFNAWTYTSDSLGIRVEASALTAMIGTGSLVAAIAETNRRYGPGITECINNGSQSTYRLWLMKTASAPVPQTC